MPRWHPTVDWRFPDRRAHLIGYNQQCDGLNRRDRILRNAGDAFDHFFTIWITATADVHVRHRHAIRAWYAGRH